MCLAVPMSIMSMEGDMGRVHSAGVEMNVSLALVEDVKVGDYVIVHAGFAIQSLSPEEARETLAILERVEQSWDK
ncbi:MAG: HypC/HybG/HupF family hydrogenase formation chaperone [Deltaproteobacteria bacterium]|nr:HypC/HybG/HupF family hydrogenase formation chaperone [Deltaproteobacteria bacterium]